MHSLNMVNRVYQNVDTLFIIIAFMRIAKQIIRKKVAKFPHSVGFVIPKFWADLHSIQPGDPIDVEVQLNRLIITIPDAPNKECQP